MKEIIVGTDPKGVAEAFEVFKMRNHYDIILQMFLEDYPEAMDGVIVKQDGEYIINFDKINAFFATLDPEDYENALDIEPEDANKLSAIFAKGKEKAPAFTDILRIGDYITLFEYKRGAADPAGQKKEYRTRAKAGDVFSEFPQTLIIPSYKGYQNSLSFYENGQAHIELMKSTNGLRFDNGRLYFDGEATKPLSEVELRNLKTKEGIESIDLPFLQTFYSIILKYFETKKETPEIITLRIPDLAKFRGMSTFPNQKEVEDLLEKMNSFHDIVGILRTSRGESRFPVLNFEGYDVDENTVSFSSPYMCHILNRVYKLSTRKDRQGYAKLSNSGEPLRNPNHNYLVKPGIVREKNKAAVMNVFIITNLILGASTKPKKDKDTKEYLRQTPHIKAINIIEQNVQFKERLNSCDNAHKAQLLKRVFSKTWELLDKQTYLRDCFIDIELPLYDPDHPEKHPESIPTVKTLDMTFTFAHYGRKVNG